MKTKRKFDKVFKEECLNLINQDRTVQDVAEEKGIQPSSLYRWRRLNRKVISGSEGPALKPEEHLSTKTASKKKNNDQISSSELMENLKKENGRLREQNDVLRKAAVILGS